MWLKEILLVAFLITTSNTKSLNRRRRGACDDSQSAVIFLQGMAPDFTLFTNFFTGPTMGLSFRYNTVRTPVPSTKYIDDSNFQKHWFSRDPATMKEELDDAMARIEREEIENLIYEGICPENIVIAGMSQGGAVTIWMALFSKYKIGGFIPMTKCFNLISFQVEYI